MAAPGVIPKERLSAYERWEMNRFDAPGRRGVMLTTADQVEKIHQQAQQEGRQAGYDEGRKRAAAEAAKLSQVMAAFTRETAELDQQLAQRTLDLALEVAQQLLRKALAVKPDLVLPVIQEAIRSMAMMGEDRCLRLHPEDAKLVRQHMAEMLGSSGWQIVEDAAIARGGCRASTAQGELDATLDTRWRKIVATLGIDAGWMDGATEQGQP